jgi:membrane protease YdiL (CAAX protease family)
MFELVLKWFCGVMLVVVAVKFAAIGDAGFRRSLLSALVVSGFSSFWMVWLIVKISRQPGRPGFTAAVALRQPVPPAAKSYLAAIAVGILFAAVSAYILITRTQSPSTPLGEALQGNESSFAFILFVTLGLGAAPFLEEIMFRGYFFGVLQTFRGTSVAMWVIAGLFAFMHVGQYWGDWLAILMVTLLGLEITLLRAWSGSVIPGMIAHYLYNTLVSVLPVAVLMASNPAYVKYVSEYSHLNVAAKEELLLKSIRTRPDFAESYNDLAWLYAENRIHLDEALKLIEQALYREPGNPSFLDTKAEVLFAAGEADRARAIEEELTEKLPGSAYYRRQLQKFSQKP